MGDGDSPAEMRCFSLTSDPILFAVHNSRVPIRKLAVGLYLIKKCFAVLV